MKNNLLLGLIFYFSAINAQNKSLFETLADHNSQPLICSHRGGYFLNYPENSISIIDFVQRNLKNKPYMVEIDIRMDKNGELWVMHDESLERTTNGFGNIQNNTTSELRKLCLKDQTGKITSEKIPTFDELLKWAYPKNIYLMLDVKGNIIGKVIEKVIQSSMDDRSIILTFKEETTKQATQTKSKSIISSLVTSDIEYENFKNMHLSNEKLAAYVTEKTPSAIIEKLKDAGYITLGDSREIYYNYNIPLPRLYYESFVNRNKLNILITDYPMEVSLMKINFPYKEISKDSIKSLINASHLKKFSWLINQKLDSLQTLLHDDVYYIHSNGWKETKTELLDNLKSGKLTYTNIVVHESQVRLFDNTAIVNGKGTFSVKMEGKPYDFNLYYTEVYARDDQGIKLVSRHACKDPDK